MIPYQNGRFPRRTLLQGAAATALLAPFLVSKRSMAQTASAGPTNLVIITWPEGLEQGWQPSGSSAAFPPMIKALEKHREELLLINGLMSGYDIFNSVLAHSLGPPALWTGATSKTGDLHELASNASIDQVIAEKISAASPYQSLHFGVQTNVYSFISNPYAHFAGADNPIPAEDDPNVMFSQIVGTAMGMSEAEVTATRRRRASVLDFVKDRIKRLRGEVAGYDRPKLDEHLAGIEGLEKSLTALGGECGSSFTNLKPTFDKSAAMTDANFPAVIKLQTDLMAAALQCGLTRVATLQLANTDCQTMLPGVATTRSVHGSQHDGTYEERVAVGTYFMDQLAYIIGKFKGISMGEDKTLLDQTLIVMGSDMAIGTHAADPAAFFLAGGGGSKVKLGRYIDVEGEGLQHTKLLVSVLQAFGIDVDSYGDFPGDNAKGPLTQVNG